MPDPAAIRRDLDRVIAGHRATVQAASADLAAGRTTVAAWELAMRAAIKPLHLAAALAGAGGDRATAQRVAATELRGQYRYLEGLRSDLLRGTQPLDGTLPARAALYGEAARGTYAQAQRASHPPGTQERRVLQPAEHCADCQAAAARGWQPLGTLPRIGESSCVVNCKCAFEFQEAA